MGNIAVLAGGYKGSHLAERGVNLALQAWPIINSFLLETVILFLLTVGFFLVHRTARFLNIAHGDYATLGAYLVWTFAAVVGWNIWVAVIIAILVTGLTVVFIDRVSYRYLRGAPLALLLCSIGVALVVRYAIFMAWGARFKRITFPVPNIEIFGTVVSGGLLLSLALAGMVVLLMYVLFNYTTLGMSAKAVGDNPTLAESFGIDTERTLQFVTFISGFTATLGGVVLALYRPLTFDMGFMWILLIIAVSILAGEKINFALLLGACGIIVGGMELSLFFVPESYRMGIGFVILILAILIRRVLER